MTYESFLALERTIILERLALVGQAVLLLAFIVSIILISGKSGLNVERYISGSELYNKKKLHRSIGVMILLLTLGTAALFMLGNRDLDLEYRIFVVAVILGNSIYINKNAKNSNS